MGSLKAKLIAISLSIALIPLLLMGIMNIGKTTSNVHESVEANLAAIVRAKEAALEDYLKTSEKAAKSFAETDAMRKYVAYLNREIQAEELAAYEAATDEIDNILYSYQEANWGVYHHIFVADLKGEVTLSPQHGAKEKGSPSSHFHSDIAQNKWFAPALENAQITDYSTFAEADHYHQLLMHPVKDSTGKTQAVIGMELMISHEQDILAKDFKLGETGKIYLATLEGSPVVHLKGQEKRAIKTAAMVEAQTSGFSAGLTENEQGKEVIGYYLRNEKYPWVLVAEIEAEEAFRGIESLRDFLVYGLALTALVVIILSVLLSNYVSSPLKKLTEATRKVTDGELDVKLPEWKSNDEIGELIGSVEMLIASIKSLRK